MTKPTTHLDYKKRLDTSIRPQDDFFDYVNKKWLVAHPIPGSETRWGMFNVLHDEAQQHMREIYEELLNKDVPTDSLAQQARDLYHSGMHFNDYEPEHLALVDEYFNRINAITRPEDLSVLLGELHTTGMDGSWRLVVDADDKDSTQHILRLAQPSLTLPDRDYYLQDTKNMRQIRTQYQEHAKKVYAHFPALAKDEATFWHTIWTFECDIAKASRSRIELRDVEKNYHKTSFKKLVNDYQHIDWASYAATLGWDTSSRISVDQPEYFAFINEQIIARPLKDWKVYLMWRFLMQYYGKISTRFAELKFEFFGKALGGTTEILPLWKRVVATIDAALGEGIGQLYAQKHFPEASKQQVLTLVEDIRTAYKERIETLDWMNEPTKNIALKKLANTKVLIGYPDTWRSFSGLSISPHSYLANVIAAEQFDSAYWLGKLLQPISRDDWFMNPQTVNAYNDPNRLVICFPAAILQKPFFDAAAPYAANMGAIGAVIGHEFTHGFDDQGCQFDENGNVRTWQTAVERKAFAKRAQVIIDQADHFEVLPGVHLKGKLVIGESIADLGGLEIAYHAMTTKLKDKLQQTASDGLNAEELFFISFTITECGATREERQRELALRDPHPAERFRVNAMLSHCESFYQVFNVQPGDQLYRPPKSRAHIW